ncbi:retinol dehydrogenase 12 [Apiospora phragmitis]|uniref:Retinol dehydrogenase 12 n=1 Tax=Apiospora phragmitis TaxID=2905665 RepID=A0ABR1VG37_9PEZI
MASVVFNEPEKRAGLLAFLQRQLLVTPPLPRNVNIHGRAAVVTGSNAGIGLECARQPLDLRCSKLILAGEAATKYLLRDSRFTDREVVVWSLDLESYESIAHFTNRAKSLDHLDIAVLNAGIMQHEHELHPDTNHEKTIQVNLISTALLAVLLLPALSSKTRSADSPGRIALVSSEMASWSTLSESSIPILPTLDKSDRYDIFGQYMASKLLLQLFVSQLSLQVPSSSVIITMPNPGLCYGTGLGHAASGPSLADRIAAGAKRLVGRSPSVGARMLTDAVVNHGLEAHGQYIEDCQVQPMAPIVYKPAGEILRQSLWDEYLGLAELSAYHIDETIRELSDS